MNQPLPSFDTPPKDVREHADRILTILRTPGRWCQGVYALGPEKAGADHSSPNAVSCCLVGAIWRAYVKAYGPAPLHREMERIAGVSNLANWNDEPGRTVDQVIELVQRAAKNIEAREVSVNA